MFKRIKNLFKGRAASTQEAAGVQQVAMANWGIDAARYDEAWPWSYWPLRTNDEWDQMDLTVAWQRARQLYVNCAPVKAAVEQLVRYTGVLTPLPVTADEKWNKLALEAWNRRTKNPHLFDLAGRVNYRQAMRFCERCAIIDGDVAVVPTLARDGGGAFAFYRAPQVAGGGTSGVETDKHGRPIAYWLTAEDGKVARVEAYKVVLYQHNPDPSRLRGYTMLAPALRNAHDLGVIVGYAKQGVKLSSSMGLVTTKTEKAQGLDIGPGMGSRGGRGRGGAQEADAPQLPSALPSMGLTVTHLPQGMDIKALSDTRPSQQLQAFWEFLVKSIAWGVALDHEALFTTNTLASGAVRFSLEKLQRFQGVMAEDQEPLAMREWRWVISREIAMGRLPACSDPAWMTPRWVPERDMTIDTARQAQAQINLTNEGMADLEDYCLRTTGRTPLDLARRQAAYLCELKKIAAAHGLTLAELRPRQVGTVPAPAAGEDDAQEGGEGKDKPAEDDAEEHRRSRT